ncbi:hypothetical protein [Paraburkholderia terrae]|uniref:hypothetical protein n=1 Tax=Paraburkholderia terrae TaxID=311230 RepID=UPI001EE336D9|nr:hypothetical protein [Paraburkholderia terrae]GJH00238.1 hypothetical protein CBA19C8_06795 [Paraburkholderia terrae]
MQPKISFLKEAGALFARIVSATRDLTVTVEAQDEQAVRQAATNFRAQAARLIERAEFIEASLAPAVADHSATPWVSVPHPMLAGVFAVKRTVTLEDATQRVEYVSVMDKPVTDPNKAANFAWRQNSVTKAAWLNADDVVAGRSDVADFAAHRAVRYSIKAA